MPDPGLPASLIMARHSKSLARCVCGLVLVGLLGACSTTTAGVSRTESHAGRLTATPTPSRSGDPASGTAVPRSFEDLARRLITDVPAGFDLQPDDVGDTGPSDLAKAVRDDGQPDAAQQLKAEGFLRGYQRLWMDDADDQVIAFIYQFSTSTGARAYYSRSDRLLIKEQPSATRFNVPALPHDNVSGAFASIDGGYSVAVIAASGPFVMQLLCNASKTDGLKQRASMLATEQYHRL